MRIWLNGKSTDPAEPFDEMVIRCVDKFVAREVSPNLQFTDEDLEWLQALARWNPQTPA